VDQDFIKGQLELKLESESSPLVYKKVLEFGPKLLDYIKLENLLEQDTYLLRLFTIDVFGSPVNLEDDSEEMQASFKKQNSQWLESRTSAIDLVFNQLYSQSKNDEANELFFNCFLLVSSRLFEINSNSLLNKLRSTRFFTDLQQKKETSPQKQQSAPFYTNGSNVSTDSKNLKQSSSSPVNIYDELNDLFEAYLQTSVKYMIANKVNKVPKCFDRVFESNRRVKLLDLMILEISLRLTAQSLFLTNASYFFNVSVTVLKDFVGKLPIAKLKKAKSLEYESSPSKLDEKKLNNFSNYSEVVEKQAVKNVPLLFCIYSLLFKSLSIQLSNFVNASNRVEIGAVLGKLYGFLCDEPSSYANVIITKLMRSHCFSNSVNTTTNQTSGSFFQFAFKFLITVRTQSFADQNNNSDQVIISFNINI
jgi:hypothetical protein